MMDEDNELLAVPDDPITAKMVAVWTAPLPKGFCDINGADKLFKVDILPYFGHYAILRYERKQTNHKFKLTAAAVENVEAGTFPRWIFHPPKKFVEAIRAGGKKFPVMQEPEMSLDEIELAQKIYGGL